MKFKKSIIIGFFLIIAAAAGYFVFYARLNQAKNLPSVNNSRSFSVVVLPDIQNYSSYYPEIFCRQIEWIIANKKKLNIVFVSQLGDIVNNGARKMSEWENASGCLSRLDGQVPYSLIPGNHDTDAPGQKSSGFSAFDKTFPASRFNKYPWYGGNYENNRNNFQTIAANGLKLLFLNLEIEPSDKALAWAAAVVKAHQDFYTILTTHEYLLVNSKARDNSVDFSRDGNSGEGIWLKLVKDNCAIAMVLSGHNHGENRQTSLNSCGREVNEIVQDYQGREKGGNGWLRLYIFTPKNHAINVYTYSPYLDQLETDDDSQFVL